MKLSLPQFSLSTLSRRERLLATGGAVLLAIVVLDRLVLSPWWQHTAKVRHEVRQLETTIRANRQVIIRKPRILGELAAYKDYIRPEEPSNVDMAALLREVEALGAKSGVQLGEVKPLEGTVSGMYQEYVFEVQYRGSLQQWVHFLYLLETSKSLFEIEKATATRAAEGTDLLDGSVRLTSKVPRSQKPT